MRGEGAAEGARPGGVGRAHVDDQAAFLQARQRLQHDLAHDVAVGQHGDEDVGIHGRRLDGRVRAVAVGVVRLKRIAGGGQVRRHGRTHGAQTDEGYSFDANTSRAQRKAATAEGTPA